MFVASKHDDAGYLRSLFCCGGRNQRKKNERKRALPPIMSASLSPYSVGTEMAHYSSTRDNYIYHGQVRCFACQGRIDSAMGIDGRKKRALRMHEFLQGAKRGT